MLKATANAILVGLALLVLPGPARGDHLPTVKVIDADQLKAWIDGGKKMLVVDSRIASEYKEGHIPTAINIPAAAMERNRKKLPRDPNSMLVFYCNGWPECKKSHEGCSKAVQWGYQNVYWFREGLPAWQAKGYPVE